MSLCVYNRVQTLVGDNLQDHLCAVHISENGNMCNVNYPLSLHAADDLCKAINALLADLNVYVVPQTPSIRMMCTGPA